MAVLPRALRPSDGHSTYATMRSTKHWCAAPMRTIPSPCHRDTYLTVRQCKHVSQQGIRDTERPALVTLCRWQVLLLECKREHVVLLIGKL